MTKPDMAAIKKTLDTVDLQVAKERPRLLFGPELVPVIRRRAAAREGLLERLRARCRDILKTPAETVDPNIPSHSSSKAVTMAEGAFLAGETEFADWAKRRIDALLAERTWMAPVHGEGGGPDSHCDHVITNVAAHVAYAHDLLGDAYTEAETARLAEGLRAHCLLQFLFSTRTRAAWWAWEDWETNWKIMCCGETGLSVCAFADSWPESREALWLATRGVIETLDAVPPEGDWQEGVTYWFVTLFMGLRFAAALRRLTGGEVDLFDHPALSITGDFAMMMTTPGGRVYNFNDNEDRLVGNAAEALLLLATLTGRRDWLAVARRFPTESPLWLATDDPDIPSETPTRGGAAKFPYTGVVTMRSGWGPDATFVGFKCSPSEVSHGHLDANSFVLEAGGVPLVIDEGTWPYGAHMGYGDTEMLRWNWDALSTVGHNTLLVDGQGQAQGKDCVGRIVSLENGRGWDMVVGDASKTYPGLLRSFVRTLLFIHPDILVVRDVVECDGSQKRALQRCAGRHVEWLLHYAGSIRTQDAQDEQDAERQTSCRSCSSPSEAGFPTTIVENEGVRLVVTPFLPDRSQGWRVSDVTRASVYESHSTLRDVTPSVRYRSFSPFRAAARFEFLFGLRVDGDAKGRDWEFTPGPDGWTLKPDGTDQVILPGDSGLRLEGASGAPS